MKPYVLFLIVLLAACGGQPAPSGSPSPIPSPGGVSVSSAQMPQIPAHVLTWMSFEDTADLPLPTVPLASFASDVDWALLNSGGADNESLQAAGIKTAVYTDPNHYIVGDSTVLQRLFTIADVAASCSKAPVAWAKPGIKPAYITDIRLADVAGKWKAALDAITQAHGPFTAAFEDTSDDPYTYASPGPPCASNGQPVLATTWTNQTAKMEGAVGYPVIFNDLASNGKGASAGLGLLHGPALGGLAESCYGNRPTSPKANGARWIGEAQTELYAHRQHKLFVCHNEETTDGATPIALDARLYQFASFMLTYDSTTSIYGSHWAVGKSQVRVQPETGLVALAPVLQVSDVSQLVDAFGVYQRLYADCRLNGVKVGACDFAVNPDAKKTQPLHLPFAAGHVLALSGSGILDGGTVILLPAAPPSTLGPTEAIVVFP